MPGVCKVAPGEGNEYRRQDHHRAEPPQGKGAGALWRDQSQLDRIDQRNRGKGKQQLTYAAQAPTSPSKSRAYGNGRKN